MENGFSKDELTFLEEPPKETEIECPICLQVMLNDPHLVECCGHHFCGTCIKRVKDSNGACPYCKRIVYQAVSDKGCLRIINVLKVKCTNKHCEWKGELKYLPVHLNKGKREGQCQYEEVTCVHSGCEIKNERQYLVEHEKDECPQRPYECRYCHHKGTYQFIVNKHYPECTQYPVPCPKECGHEEIPLCNIPAHLTEECPLQSVDCEFKWAGCQYTPLRKDLQQHNNDSQLEHMSLLAKECRELKKENEESKRENQELKSEIQNSQQELKKGNAEIEKLKKENHKLTQKILRIHHRLVGDTYPIVPVGVQYIGYKLYFYSDVCGHFMSVCREESGKVVLKVYKGKFQQPKVTEVVVNIDECAIETLTTISGCHGYCEYPDEVKRNVVQKFSFELPHGANIKITSVS